MADIEKAIKGLEVCTSRPCFCKDCPYKKGCALDSQEVMEDALELLKSWQKKKPILSKGVYWCASCGEMLVSENPSKHEIRFCKYCGQAVEWEQT